MEKCSHIHKAENVTATAEKGLVEKQGSGEADRRRLVKGLKPGEERRKASG